MAQGFTKDHKFRPTGSKSDHKMSSAVMGFNLKTRKKEVILDPHTRITSNGRKQVVGHGKDGTPIFAFVAS